MKVEERDQDVLLGRKKVPSKDCSSENKLNNRIALFRREKLTMATKEENRMKFITKAFHDIQFNMPKDCPFTNFNLLTKGGFSYVYTCQRDSDLFTQNIICCKYVPKIIYYDRTFEGIAYEDYYMKNIEKSEIDSMREINSNHSVEFLTHCRTLDGGFVAFLKFYRNGCLLTFLTQNNLFYDNTYLITPFLLKYLAWQFFCILKDLKCFQVQHNDIKPENVLVDDDLVIRLSDYGLARRINKEDGAKRFLSKGTYFYLSPEKILKTKLDAAQYNEHALKVDVWAVGVTLFMFGCNCFPYGIRKDDNKAKMLKKMSDNTLSFDKVKWAELGSNFSETIGGMLHFDVTKRLDIDQVLETDFAAECQMVFEKAQKELQRVRNKDGKKKVLKKLAGYSTKDKC